MNVEVLRPASSDLPILANLLQLYLHDFSEFMGWDLPDDGRFPDDDLAGCWTEPHRHPYLFRVDGKLGGFSIVDGRSDITGETDVRDVAEFFVLRRWRRKGVGTLAATRLFDLHPGKWEVRELVQNVDGLAFWHSVIDRYTGGRFSERLIPVHRRMSHVQSFSSPGVLRVCHNHAQTAGPVTSEGEQ